MSSLLSISRQAVIIIHGIGEQRPMDTLREFTRSVAPANQNPEKPPFFSKPDQFSDSFELRRLAAHRQKNSYKTDYFELYWAHLMLGTQLKDIAWWIKNMFLGWPDHIPKRLRWIWFVFWLTSISALVILLLIYKGVLIPQSFRSQGWFKVLSSVAVALVSMIINGVLLNYLGDAVRYFAPRPGNIAERQQIRKAGISLLRRLHSERNQDGSNRYDRIIIVGHSLGSVIAYDILSLFWIEVAAKLSLNPADIDLAEQAANDFRKSEMNPQDLELYRRQQFKFWLSQYKKQDSWRISDLMTVGSPLAFADLHLAENEEELELKKQQREFPTSPPRTEAPTPKQLNKLADKKKLDWFSYPATDDGSQRTLHHAAPFAMTRWTNMYFKNDYVGGPVTCFDPGIENKEFISKKHNSFPFASHTHYWDTEETESLHYLQSKMQLTFDSIDFLNDQEPEADV